MISETDSAATIAAFGQTLASPTPQQPRLAESPNQATTTTTTTAPDCSPSDLLLREDVRPDVGTKGVHEFHSHKEISAVKSPPTSTTMHTSTMKNGGKSITTTTASHPKKRKRFEEAIIDGFAIMAFKTWEDLQDELNERHTINSMNSNKDHCTANIDNVNNNNSKKVKAPKGSASNTSTSASFNHESNSSNSKESKKSSKDKSTKKSSKDLSSTESSSTHASSKDKSQSSQRNKTSSSSTAADKVTHKKTISAKDLNYERRLSILEEKLKQEQNKNRSISTSDNNSNDTNDKSITSSGNLENNRYDCHVNHRDSDTHDRNKNGTSIDNNDRNNRKSPSDVLEHYSSSQSYHHNHQHDDDEREHQTAKKPNGVLGPDLLRDPMALHGQPTPYSPFHMNPHLQHKSSITSHSNAPPQHLLYQPPNYPNQSSTPQSASRLLHQVSNNVTPNPLQFPKHPAYNHQPTPPPSAPRLHTPSSKRIPSPPQSSGLTSNFGPHNMQHAQFTQRQQLPNQPHLLLQPPPNHTPASALHHPAFPSQHHHQTTNSMITSMGLGTLPPPYNCPPSIYITDTITRQTNIIPPPHIPAGALEAPPVVPPASVGRYGPSSVLQSMTPYGSAVPPHHPSMFYPTLPTERSFIEFARSYTGPSHLAYPSLMGPFSSSAPGASAAAAAAAAAASNPYNFDRWPRMTLDHQRAVSRYNSLYQSSTTLSDRTAYAGYAARPPFPAGLFPPPF